MINILINYSSVFIHLSLFRSLFLVSGFYYFAHVTNTCGKSPGKSPFHNFARNDCLCILEQFLNIAEFLEQLVLLHHRGLWPMTS